MSEFRENSNQTKTLKFVTTIEGNVSLLLACSDENKSLYFIFVRVVFSQHLGLFLGQQLVSRTSSSLQS
jgi:hypothetical protein